MNKQKLYLQNIRRACPDLHISSVASNDQGQYNDVLIVNAELIFRFDQAIACELPLSDTRQKCLDIYTRMREKLFPHMRPDARHWASDHFETFIESFLDRVHFYRGTFALLEALFGIENDDQRAFESGIKEYV